MRNLVKLMVFAGLFGVTLLGCKKEESRTGSLKVQMVDAPADFTEVNVNILEVWAHYEGGNGSSGGWIQLNAIPGFYDLLQLQNGVMAVIANPTQIPVGNISQLRLILGDNNYVVETIDSVSTQLPLNLSSQDETGLKINLNSEIQANQTIVVTLDFDAEQSIVEQGNGEYKLKPVIKVESVIYVP